jgi:hypothetical protein
MDKVVPLFKPFTTIFFQIFQAWKSHFSIDQSLNDFEII